MSDPLSVAGSAVGIISLGIQVCQGLVSYLQSFKSQDQDIQDSLNDIQTVTSILYSLKGILPNVEKGSPDKPAIRRCLAESEEKLREFHQFSLKLRGAENPEHDVLGRMDNARRALLYPFREGKLKSLCQSLKGLLQSLSLCLDITTLDIAVGIHTNVEDLGNAFKDQDTNAAKLSDQLQRLDNNMSAYYQDLKGEMSQAQLFAQEFRQDIGGQLRLISTDVGSLMSINRRHQEDMNRRLMKAFDELKEQHNFQNELMRTTLGMDNMSIQSTDSRQATTLVRTRNSNQFLKKPPGCNCKRQHEYSALSYRFWHATFEYEQHSPGQHARSCRYFRIDQPMKRIARAHLPFKLWLLSSRLFVTCIEYSLGTATPGMSIQYRSIVPKRQSPVYHVLRELLIYIRRRSLRVTAKEISLRITEAERAILSLYRDRESSPYDQDENGESHAMLALETILHATDIPSLKDITQLTRESFSRSAIGMIKTLASTAGDENVTIDIFNCGSLLIDEWKSLAQACITTFNIDFLVFLFYIYVLGYQPGPLWLLLERSGHNSELHPIGQAIFQESITLLEIALAKFPEAVTERVRGFTTVQLCVNWPEGLQKLLRSKAVDILDERDLSLAVRANCIESVDLLFKAGCPINYRRRTKRIFRRASERCMDVIASNLARRRLDLLSLAQQQQVVGQDLVLISDIPDNQASYLCSCLDNSGIIIPSALRVPSSYSTIYHFCGTTIHHYPILFKNGFTNLSTHNKFGLLPTMTQYRYHEPTWLRDKYRKRIEGIDWLESQKIMDQTPTDPLNLGLNIQATSWHYLSRYCPDLRSRKLLVWARCSTFLQVREFYPKRTNGVLGVPVIDDCRCWCVPSDRGCTPLTTALKSYVKEFNEPKPNVLCDFFHTAVRDTETIGSRIRGWCIEVIRLLTFEALEMTHTCCEFTVVDRPDISSEKFDLLMNCDQERWQKIRSDKREQENAALLETLMEEFIAYMIGMKSSSRSLEIFVNGYWRQRMSEIYAVDSNEIRDIRNCLIGTKTYVLPDRVRPLLRKGFTLIKQQDLKSELTPVGETAHDERVELGDEPFEMPPCRRCRILGNEIDKKILI